MVYHLPEWGNGKRKWQTQNRNQLVGKISLVYTKGHGETEKVNFLRINQSSWRENGIYQAPIVLPDPCKVPV